VEKINIKDVVKLTKEENDWFDKHLIIGGFANPGRPDLERGLLLYYLAKKNKAKRCLDIGTASFFSAKAMAKSGAIVDTIDIEGEKPTDEGLYKNINFIKGDSKEIVPNLKHQYDLTFIDGDHEYETVRQDIINSQKISKIVVCHDYGNLEGPTMAIDEIIQPKEMIICDRMWYGAAYENGIDKNGEKINYGIVVWTEPSN